MKKLIYGKGRQSKEHNAFCESVRHRTSTAVIITTYYINWLYNNLRFNYLQTLCFIPKSSMELLSIASNKIRNVSYITTRPNRLYTTYIFFYIFLFLSLPLVDLFFYFHLRAIRILIICAAAYKLFYTTYMVFSWWWTATRVCVTPVNWK